MYEFQKLVDEEILFITDDTVLKKANNDIKVSLVVTNKRLLLLDYPSKVNNYQENLKGARVLNYLSKKEVILEVFLCDIDVIEKADDYDKYVLKNGNYFFIRNSEVRKYVM